MNRMNSLMDWDERYKSEDFAYGKEPNLFFKECLSQYPLGAILMPADGEGRNGVFAARLGWRVTSFDISKEGRSKALQLAEEYQVELDYKVGRLEQLSFETNSFDAVGLIYAHFAEADKPIYHKMLNNYLKPGGLIILEAFGKKHLNLVNQDSKVGGPKELGMLYSKDELLNDFRGFEVLMLTEEEVLLNEGKYHNGKGSVIRFVGRKAGR